MSRPRKFTKGEKLTLFEALAFIVGGEWVFEGDRPKNPSFMISRRVIDLKFQAGAGRLHRAIPNPDHPDNKEA